MAKRGRKSRYEGKTAEEAIRMTVAEVQRREGMTPCWEWQAGKDGRGYGWLTFEGVKQHAHRFAYRTHKNDYDARLGVLHKCDNPACCNPSHLYQGTQSQNLRDSWERNWDKRRSAAFSAIASGRTRDKKGRFVS